MKAANDNIDQVWLSLPKTPEEAKNAGVRFYFTGKLCVNGHYAPRYASNKRCKVCSDASIKKWQAENKEQTRASSEAWRKEHREHVNALNRERKERDPESREVDRRRTKEWRMKNPEKAKQHVRTRRARRLSAEGSHTPEDIHGLLVLQRHRCAICSTNIRKGYNIDHIIPLSRGGGDGKDNLQILCSFCNHSKHNKDPIDWALSQGRLV